MATLPAWLEDAAPDKRVFDRLIEEAAEWAANGEDPSHLAQGADFEAFQTLRDKRAVWLSSLEHRFVQASHDAELARAALERIRTRRAWQLRNAALAAAAIFLLAAGLATWFWRDARQQADRALNAERQAIANAERAQIAQREAIVERDRARVQLLAMQARRMAAGANTPDEIERAGALALESIEIARKGNRPPEADAVEAARSALIRLPLLVLPHGSPVWSLAVLADGRLASGGEDQIKLWPKDGRGEPVILAHGSQVQSLAVLADGRLASGGDDGQIKLWPKDGRRRARGPRARQPGPVPGGAGGRAAGQRRRRRPDQALAQGRDR